MIVKDAEKTIEKSLESLQEFKEIVLYLNNSTIFLVLVQQKTEQHHMPVVIGFFLLMQMK
jgi:hypothetical protein